MRNALAGAKAKTFSIPIFSSVVESGPASAVYTTVEGIFPSEQAGVRQPSELSEKQEMANHLSISEVARLLQVSEAELRNRCEQGELAAEIQGGEWRIAATEVDRLKGEFGDPFASLLSGGDFIPSGSSGSADKPSTSMEISTQNLSEDLPDAFGFGDFAMPTGDDSLGLGALGDDFGAAPAGAPAEEDDYSADGDAGRKSIFDELMDEEVEAQASPAEIVGEDDPLLQLSTGEGSFQADANTFASDPSADETFGSLDSDSFLIDGGDGDMGQLLSDVSAAAAPPESTPPPAAPLAIEDSGLTFGSDLIDSSTPPPAPIETQAAPAGLDLNDAFPGLAPEGGAVEITPAVVIPGGWAKAGMGSGSAGETILDDDENMPPPGGLPMESEMGSAFTDSLLLDTDIDLTGAAEPVSKILTQDEMPDYEEEEEAPVAAEAAVDAESDPPTVEVPFQPIAVAPSVVDSAASGPDSQVLGGDLAETTEAVALPSGGAAFDSSGSQLVASESDSDFFGREEPAESAEPVAPAEAGGVADSDFWGSDGSGTPLGAALDSEVRAPDLAETTEAAALPAGDAAFESAPSELVPAASDSDFFGRDEEEPAEKAAPLAAASDSDFWGSEESETAAPAELGGSMLDSEVRAGGLDETLEAVALPDLGLTPEEGEGALAGALGEETFGQETLAAEGLAAEPAALDPSAEPTPATDFVPAAESAPSLFEASTGVSRLFDDEASLAAAQAAGVDLGSKEEPSLASPPAPVEPAAETAAPSLDPAFDLFRDSAPTERWGDAPAAAPLSAEAPVEPLSAGLTESILGDAWAAATTPDGEATARLDVAPAAPGEMSLDDASEEVSEISTMTPAPPVNEGTELSPIRESTGSGSLLGDEEDDLVEHAGAAPAFPGIPAAPVGSLAEDFLDNELASGDEAASMDVTGVSASADAADAVEADLLASETPPAGLSSLVQVELAPTESLLPAGSAGAEADLMNLESEVDQLADEAEVDSQLEEFGATAQVDDGVAAAVGEDDGVDLELDVESGAPDHVEAAAGDSGADLHLFFHGDDEAAGGPATPDLATPDITTAGLGTAGVAAAGLGLGIAATAGSEGPAEGSPPSPIRLYGGGDDVFGDDAGVVSGGMPTMQGSLPAFANDNAELSDADFLGTGDSNVLGGELEASADSPMQTVKGPISAFGGGDEQVPIIAQDGSSVNTGEDEPFFTTAAAGGDASASSSEDGFFGEGDASVLGAELEGVADGGMGTIKGPIGAFGGGEEEEVPLTTHEDENLFGGDADVLGGELEAATGGMQTVKGPISSFGSGEEGEVPLTTHEDESLFGGDESFAGGDHAFGAGGLSATGPGASSAQAYGGGEPGDEEEDDDDVGVLGPELEGVGEGAMGTVKGPFSRLQDNDESEIQVSLGGNDLLDESAGAGSDESEIEVELGGSLLEASAGGDQGDSEIEIGLGGDQILDGAAGDDQADSEIEVGLGGDHLLDVPVGYADGDSEIMSGPPSESDAPIEVLTQLPNDFEPAGSVLQDEGDAADINEMHTMQGTAEEFGMPSKVQLIHSGGDDESSVLGENLDLDDSDEKGTFTGSREKLAAESAEIEVSAAAGDSDAEPIIELSAPDSGAGILDEDLELVGVDEGGTETLSGDRLEEARIGLEDGEDDEDEDADYPRQVLSIMDEGSGSSNEFDPSGRTIVGQLPAGGPVSLRSNREEDDSDIRVGPGGYGDDESDVRIAPVSAPMDSSMEVVPLDDAASSSQELVFGSADSAIHQRGDDEDALASVRPGDPTAPPVHSMAMGLPEESSSMSIDIDAQDRDMGFDGTLDLSAAGMDEPREGGVEKTIDFGLSNPFEEEEAFSLGDESAEVEMTGSSTGIDEEAETIDAGRLDLVADMGDESPLNVGIPMAGLSGIMSSASAGDDDLVLSDTAASDVTLNPAASGIGLGGPSGIALERSATSGVNLGDEMEGATVVSRNLPSDADQDFLIPDMVELSETEPAADSEVVSLDGDINEGAATAVGMDLGPMLGAEQPSGVGMGGVSSVGIGAASSLGLGAAVSALSGPGSGYPAGSSLGASTIGSPGSSESSGFGASSVNIPTSSGVGFPLGSGIGAGQPVGGYAPSPYGQPAQPMGVGPMGLMPGPGGRYVLEPPVIPYTAGDFALVTSAAVFLALAGWFMVELTLVNASSWVGISTYAQSLIDVIGTIGAK